MHGVLAERRHQGQNHDAHDDSGGEGVEPGKRRDNPLEEGGDEKQGEVPVDHGGNSCQDLEDGFADIPCSWGSIFAEENGDENPQRRGNENGNACSEERSAKKWQDAEVLLIEEWGPLGVSEKGEYIDFPEEQSGFEKEHSDDTQGGEDGHKTEDEKEMSDKSLFFFGSP